MEIHWNAQKMVNSVPLIDSLFLHLFASQMCCQLAFAQHSPEKKCITYNFKIHLSNCAFLQQSGYLLGIYKYTWLSLTHIWTFILPPTTSTKILSSGQWVSGSTCWAKLSFPSSLFPMVHWTNPPYMLLQALPEPWRAIADSSPSTPNTWARL